MAQNIVGNNQTNSQMSDELMRDLSALYRAARRGDVQALEHLLQRNASILDNIPDDGCETPLHISALLNHTSFTQVLLNRNGDLATRKDASGRTALHLASAEDNLEAVQRLLEFNDEPCLVADRKGRIPLHYAAMRGRTEVVEALVIARPDSLGRFDPERSTVFHLCVTYNRFKTLQALVKLDYATANVTVGTPRAPIFTLPDRTGNTILHLAVMYMRDEEASFNKAYYPEAIPQTHHLTPSTARPLMIFISIVQDNQSHPFVTNKDFGTTWNTLLRLFMDQFVSPSCL
ncbi:alpha-latroinsectotoxin-Lt1a-like [Neltuma alba]|uniref:alpha-latroinsectotoxin-Lt1a-like n=1 Tax=Neltuma alba TaxID=207710 RepID=UPI0010A2C4C7|nr:alpha-latroinsectotoxin-Lt1a-like [Prosopis alba]